MIPLVLAAAAWPLGLPSYPIPAEAAPAAPPMTQGTHDAAPQPHPPAKGAGLGGALLPAGAPQTHKGHP